MKRRSPNTSNGDTPATDVVVKNIATAGRSRLARKCKPDSRTAGKKAAPPALTKEEVLANVDLVPAGKKKRKVAAAVLDPADILGSALAGSFVGTRPSFGLQRLKYGFYDVPCEELARSLLGKVLVRRLDGRTLLKGRIVETECYPGGSDKASVSHNGRITESNVPVYMRPGTCFVYMTYGMYHCFNISSQGAGAAVLLRALDPLEGLDQMQEQRQRKGKSGAGAGDKPRKLLKPHELCNGPAKLCMCLHVEKDSCNKQDLTSWDGLWVEEDELSEQVKPHHIVVSTRIGIDSVGFQWASKPLRFYVSGNKSVSRIDKVKEEELSEPVG